MRKIHLFKFTAIILCIATLVLSAVSTACAIPLPDTSSAQAVCLYCIENKQNIYSVRADEKVYPASTVKIMTAILALEYYKDKLDTPITVNSSVLKGMTGNYIGLSDGEILTAEQLIASVIIGNANDSALVLADAIGGSVEGFVALMNEKAEEIGCTSTNYTNPTGMDDAMMYSTAYDIALISAYAYSVPKYTDFSSQAKYNIPQTENCVARTVHNKNYFTSTWINPDYYDSSINGLNSGATDEAGYCLVATKYQGSQTYVCVVMGADYDEENNIIRSYTTATELLNWVKNNYKYVTLLDSSKIICEIPVTMSSSTDYVTLLPEKSIEMFLPNDIDLENDVKIEWVLDSDSLEAPVASGQIVGIATVTYNNTIVGRVGLVTKNSVDSDAIMHILSVGKDIVASIWFKIAVIAIILFAVAYVLAVARIRFIKKQRILVNNNTYFSDYRKEENKRRDEKMRNEAKARAKATNPQNAGNNPTQQRRS